MLFSSVTDQHCKGPPSQIFILIHLSLSLSLRFNGHFPGEPGLACVYWSKGWWKWWWQLELLVVQSSSQIITTNIQFFTGRMPFLSPNQQCQSTEGKISHSLDLLTPSSPGGVPTLSLTTNSSWLHWWRVAMALISPLVPVPKYIFIFIHHNLIEKESINYSNN